MPRKIRSDIKIGNLEKKLGLNKGAIRNPDGTDARSDKKLGKLREEYQRQFDGPPVRTRSGPKDQSNKSTSVTKKASPIKAKTVTPKEAGPKRKKS